MWCLWKSLNLYWGKQIYCCVFTRNKSSFLSLVQISDRKTTPVLGLGHAYLIKESDSTGWSSYIYYCLAIKNKANLSQKSNVESMIIINQISVAATKDSMDIACSCSWWVRFALMLSKVWVQVILTLVYFHCKVEYFNKIWILGHAACEIIACPF